MNPTEIDLAEKFRRAVVLIQLLLSPEIEVAFEAEDEARQQLKEWGVNVPCPVSVHED